MAQGSRGLLVAALFLLPIALTATAAPPADELGRKEQELSDLRANIQQLRETLGAAKDERNRLTEELAKTEQAIGALARSAYDLAIRIDAAQTRLNELEARRRKKQDELAEQPAPSVPSCAPPTSPGARNDSRCCSISRTPA